MRSSGSAFAKTPACRVLASVVLMLLLPACERHHGMGTAMHQEAPVSAAVLPDADSTGARLVRDYCGQCHGVPAPTTHPPGKWRPVVERMVLLMKTSGRKVPGAPEIEQINAYLRQHAG